MKKPLLLPPETLPCSPAGTCVTGVRPGRLFWLQVAVATDAHREAKEISSKV